LEVSVLQASTAREVDEIFVAAMNAGDLDAALSVYDEETLFLPGPGEEPVRGVEQLRTTLAQFIALKPKLRVVAKQFVELDDIAFYSLAWELDGTDADGNAVHLSGVDANIVRRKADGSWKVLLDNPFHLHHVGHAA
jgi:uncharacterized protein (TIGR02246 family)